MLNGVEFLKKLESGKLSNFYFMLGDEDYLIDVAVDRIVELLKAEKRVLYGDEITAAAIFQEGGKLDLFGTAKPIVTVVKHVHKLKDWSKGFKKRSPQRGVIILAAESVEELSRRWFRSGYPLRPAVIERNLKKYLPPETVYLHFPVIDKNSPLFSRWLKRELDRRKLHINRMLWQQFVDALPSKMRMILNELDKIALYFGEEGGDITEKIIMRFLAYTGEAEGLAIANMIVEGDAKSLITTIDELLRDGAQPGHLIGITSTSFAKMLQLKAGAKKVRLPASLASKYRKFVETRRVYEVMGVFERFADMDMRSKTYSQSPSILTKKTFLEVLIELSGNKRRKSR